MFTGHSSAPGRPRSNQLPIAELAARLRNNATEVARALLGPENRALSTRQEKRWGNNGSLSVRISGSKKGRWFDHEAVEGGDMFSLTVRQLGSEAAAYEWARRWCGDSGTGEPADATPRPNPTPPARGGGAEAAKDEKAHSEAASVLLAAVPIKGTQAERYLEGRGLAVPEGSPLLFHGDILTGQKRRFPALIAPFSLPDGTACRAYQATFLDREGAASKAPIPKGDQRRTRASPGEGAIWLTDPLHGRRLFIAEGVETALSAWTADQSAGAVAVTGKRHAGIALPSPDELGELVFLVDIDPPAPGESMGGGEKKAREAAEHWIKQGYRVRLAFPGPRDGPKCDFNDLLQREGVEAVRAALAAAELVGSPARQSVRERIVSYIIAAQISLPRYVREVGRSQ